MFLLPPSEQSTSTADEETKEYEECFYGETATTDNQCLDLTTGVEIAPST